MIAKSAIVRELGAERLLLPTLLNDALLAEEQAEYYVALLRQARAHADAPGDVPAMGCTASGWPHTLPTMRSTASSPAASAWTTAIIISPAAAISPPPWCGRWRR
ncbi:MAG: hypothetical protein U1E35_00905 [Rhodospirillales bacterium]